MGDIAMDQQLRTAIPCVTDVITQLRSVRMGIGYQQLEREVTQRLNPGN
jgi:hypothetical protein